MVDSLGHQLLDGPDLHIFIDRTKPAEFGLTAQDVSNSVFASLSSSSQVQPNCWLDPKMATTYLVAALNTVEKVRNTPIPVRFGDQSQLLSNLATVRHSIEPVAANHRDVHPVFDVYANGQDSDLRPHCCRGEPAHVRGRTHVLWPLLNSFNRELVTRFTAVTASGSIL